MQALIRLLYALLVAGAVVTFVGFGIYSLYQPPKYPEYPGYNYNNDNLYQKQQDEFDKKQDAYDKKEKVYMKNVTYIALPVGVAFTLLGLLIFRRSEVVGEGLALGGIATSIYAIVTSSLADARILRFASVTLLLLSVLLVTYRRFYENGRHHKA
jgi:uncharacterized membrane protein YkgB